MLETGSSRSTSSATSIQATRRPSGETAASVGQRQRATSSGRASRFGTGQASQIRHRTARTGQQRASPSPGPWPPGPRAGRASWMASQRAKRGSAAAVRRPAGRARSARGAIPAASPRAAPGSRTGLRPRRRPLLVPGQLPCSAYVGDEKLEAAAVLSAGTSLLEPGDQRHLAATGRPPSARDRRALDCSCPCGADRSLLVACHLAHRLPRRRREEGPGLQPA